MWTWPAYGNKFQSTLLNWWAGRHDIVLWMVDELESCSASVLYRTALLNDDALNGMLIASSALLEGCSWAKNLLAGLSRLDLPAANQNAQKVQISFGGSPTGPALMATQYKCLGCNPAELTEHSSVVD